jgi:hypothetical protein
MEVYLRLRVQRDSHCAYCHDTHAYCCSTRCCEQTTDGQTHLVFTQAFFVS